MNAPTPALVARPDRVRLVGQRRQILAVMHQRLMFGMLVYAGVIVVVVLRLLWLAAFGDHAGRKASIVSLTPERGAQATLFRAVDTMHPPAPGLLAAATRASVKAEVARINHERRAGARTELSRAARTLTSAGWEVNQVITEGAPLRGLLATAVKVHADLVVVGATGTSGLDRLLLGSVAEGALNHNEVAVLVVR